MPTPRLKLPLALSAVSSSLVWFMIYSTIPVPCHLKQMWNSAPFGDFHQRKEEKKGESGGNLQANLMLCVYGRHFERDMKEVNIAAVSEAYNLLDILILRYMSLEYFRW